MNHSPYQKTPWILGLLLATTTFTACGPTSIVVASDDDSSSTAADTIAPLAQFASTPAPITNEKIAKFELFANEDVRFEARIRSGEAGKRFADLTPSEYQPVPATYEFQVEAGQHFLEVRAIDTAGNLQQSSLANGAFGDGSGASVYGWLVDDQPPAPPAALTVTPSGTETVRLAWEVPADSGGGGLASFRVYYDTDEASTSPLEYQGFTANEGPSPIPIPSPSATTFSLTQLDPCEPTFVALAAVDRAGNESELVRVDTRTGCGGNGTFAPGTTFVLGSEPGEFVTADFDLDGDMDVAVTLPEENAVCVLLNDGAGNLSAPSNPLQGRFSVVDEPGLITSGDVNDDGLVDLLVTHGPRSEFEYITSQAQVSVLLGRVDLPAFEHGESFEVPCLGTNCGWPLALLAEDFNVDGQLDVFVPLGAQRSWTRSPTASGINPANKGFVGQIGGVPMGSPCVEETTSAGFLGNGADGRGDGTFTEICLLETPTLLGSERVTCAAAVDFDRDSYVELVLGTSSALWLIENESIADVGFSFANDAILLASAYEPTDVAVVDVNEDGVLDVIAVMPEIGIASVWLGEASDGVAMSALRPPTDYAILAPGRAPDPSALAVADFDGDDVLDIAIANPSDASIAILQGLGDGGKGTGAFDDPEFFHVGVGAQGRSIATCDMNRDGIADLVTTDLTQGGRVSVLFGQGRTLSAMAQFRNPERRPAPFELDRLAPLVLAHDMNADGTQDLIVMQEGVELSQEPTILSILVGGAVNGRADGNFVLAGPPMLMPHESLRSDIGRALAVGDFNGDTILDVGSSGFVRRGGENGQTFVHLGLGDGRLTAPQPIGPDLGVTLTTCDFDGDGIEDLLVGGESLVDGISLAVFLGHPTDPVRQTSSSLPDGFFPSSMIARDFNRDGIPDIAVSGGGTPSEGRLAPYFRVLLGTPDAQANPPMHRGSSLTGSFAVDSGLDDSFTAMVSADVNNDRIPDVVAINASGEFRVLAGQGSNGRGNGTFSLALPSFGNGGFNTLAQPGAGDFDADGLTDFAVSRPNGDIAILISQGDGTFVEQSVVSTGAPTRSLAVGDFNSDGVPDLAVPHADSISVVFGLGSAN